MEAGPALGKFETDPEPRKNWLIEALDGLGGKCEKSFGAKCLMMSWLGLCRVLGASRSFAGGVRLLSRAMRKDDCESAELGGESFDVDRMGT